MRKSEGSSSKHVNSPCRLFFLRLLPSQSRAAARPGELEKNLLLEHCLLSAVRIKRHPGASISVLHSEGEEAMRKSVLLPVLAGFLFAASPVLATIVALLETPDNMQDVSGKSLISGWAFSTMGAPVTVILRINGADTTDTIPCCGPRLDVQNANPGAPLNSGFGRLQNYGVFDPATLNSIGVKITAAQGEAPVVIDHQVMLAKPGNAEFL